MLLRFLFSLLICALLSPASAIAAEITAGPADPQLTPAETDDLIQLPADHTALPEEDADPVQELELSPELFSLLAAQEAATQELAGLHDFLMEIWQHVRFWVVAALAYWFVKKSWQGVT